MLHASEACIHARAAIPRRGIAACWSSTVGLVQVCLDSMHPEDVLLCSQRGGHTSSMLFLTQIRQGQIHIMTRAFL